MQKRAYFLQICFAIFSFILLGKLAYEELYRSALLTGTRLNIYDSTLTPYSSLDNALAARRLDLAPNGSALLANGQQAWLYIP